MAKRRSVPRDLHDAFENDTGLDFDQAEDLDQVTTETAALAQRAVIERLPPSQMRPDRFQPRPILPIDLQRAYFQGERDCYETAAAWLARGRNEPAQQARIDTLLRMADTFDEHGQIKPITGAWVSLETHDYVFQIETGERRFWSACLHAARSGAKEEPTLRVEVVPQPSLRRQIIENRHAEPPSAVAQAREIAALVLQELELEPDPGLDDPNEYFRMANHPPGISRLPRGMWNRLQPWMDLSTRRMQQMLRILDLPTAILEQADVHRLPYRVLEAVLAAPPENQQDLVQRAIEFEMTGDEVSDLVAEIPADKTPTRKPRPQATPPSVKALRGMQGFRRALQDASRKEQDRALDEIADEVVVGGQAERMLGLLDALAARIRTRTERM